MALTAPSGVPSTQHIFSLSLREHTHRVLTLSRMVTPINVFLLKGAKLTTVAYIILAIIDEVGSALTWNIWIHILLSVA